MTALATALWATVGGVCTAVLVHAFLRRRRARREAAAFARWAAARPHLVALCRDAGPLAPFLAATVPDEVLRRWHAEDEAHRRWFAEVRVLDLSKFEPETTKGERRR